PLPADERRPRMTPTWEMMEQAIKDENLDAIRQMVADGYDLEQRDKLNCTALLYAASQRNWNAVSLLIDLGADLDTQDHDGRTALMLAIFFENSEIARKMILANARLDIVDFRKKLS